MKADRDGDERVLNGQKVWSSGAQFSEWGMAVCRSDSDLPKHKGITVFVVPMDAPGVKIRQMSGGTSFNEVFFSDVRIPDAYRVGDVGEGWKVALTVLGFERGGDGGGGRVGGTWAQVKALADHFEAWSDPVLRDDLANLYIRYRLMAMTRQRIAARPAPGPEGSISKVFWTDSMAYMSEVVARILGPRLTADTGEWGTFEWTITSWVRRATASPAAPTRSRRTSSANGCWACPANPASTRPSPSKTSRSSRDEPKMLRVVYLRGTQLAAIWNDQRAGATSAASRGTALSIWDPSTRSRRGSHRPPS